MGQYFKVKAGRSLNDLQAFGEIYLVNDDGTPWSPDNPADLASLVAAEGPVKAALSATYASANPTLVVTYNPDGSVASTTENGVLTTFTYNTNGTVNTQTRAGVTKTFSYDTNGNVTGAA